MRVLMVTSGWPSADRPSTSVMVAEQVRFLRAEGVEIEVVAYEGAMRPSRYLRARRSVRRLLRHKPFDIVHGQFGQSALVVLPSRLPTVLTFRGSDLLGVVGPSGRYTPRGRLLQALSRWGARRVDRVVISGPRLAGMLPDGVPYELIPTGVDREVFRPGSKEKARHELGLPLDKRIVVFGGRPGAPVKRFGLAREAVARMSPETRPCLRILENLSHQEVATTLQAADALLLTSRHESGPAIVKEALACGLPVVSVDVGDVREVIGDLEWCAVCDDDPDMLASELARIISTPSSPHPVPSDLMERIDQRALVRRLVNLYRDLAGS